MGASKDPKTERIDIRCTPATKALLQEGANAVDKTVSEFLLDEGVIAAANALADRRHWVLDAEQWQRFQELLDRPVQHKPALARLLRAKGPWD